MNDINSLSCRRWNCEYHIVFAPKYTARIPDGWKRHSLSEMVKALHGQELFWKKERRRFLSGNVVAMGFLPD